MTEGNITRRSFMNALAMGSAAAALGFPLAGQEASAGAVVSIVVDPEKSLATVPENYNGFSYEAAQLGHPEFFSSANKDLIALFRRLSKHGVLRMGGNTSDHTVWSPAGAPPESAGNAGVNPDAGPGPRRRTPVTPEAIRNLAQFLDATDWQLIYGLNLGTGTPEQAAEEAKVVSDAAGHRLIAFQFGNEPDLFHRNRRSDLRPAGWNFDTYFAQWQEFYKAVRKVLPRASFGAPDIANVANGTSWIEQFVEKAADEIVLISGHYYAEGPPEDPRMTIERLLQRDPRLLTNTPQSMEISRKGHHPFRMTEGNSCYNGGKRDVSDTFASALWAADYMLYLAQSGYAGVNFHGGGNGIYTPIAGDTEHGYTARAIYYGLLFAEQFADSTMVETRVEAGAANVTAYAAKSRSRLRVAIINKDEHLPVRATLRTGSRLHKAILWRLTAPGVESKTDVRLAGTAVSADGTWSADHEERLDGNGQYTIDLTPASAAIAFLG